MDHVLAMKFKVVEHGQKMFVITGTQMRSMIVNKYGYIAMKTEIFNFYADMTHTLIYSTFNPFHWAWKKISHDTARAQGAKGEVI